MLWGSAALSQAPFQEGPLGLNFQNLWERRALLSEALLSLWAPGLSGMKQLVKISGDCCALSAGQGFSTLTFFQFLNCGNIRHTILTTFKVQFHGTQYFLYAVQPSPESISCTYLIPN